jgi:hypothetical protein
MLLLVLVLTCAAVAGATHVLLFGWRRAPADGTLRLRRHQRLSLGLAACVPISGCIALLLIREALLNRFSPEILQQSFLVLVAALISLLYGAAPSLANGDEGT